MIIDIILVVVALGLGAAVYQRERVPPPPHVHVHRAGQFGPRYCDDLRCKAQYLESEGVWDDDPMYLLRKEQASIEDMIEAPLKEEFAKLERKVGDREHMELMAHISETEAYLARVRYTPPYYQHIAIPHAELPEENKSGVSEEERRRESLFNDDIPTF